MNINEMESEMTTVATLGEEELGVNIDLDLEMNDDYMTTAMDSTTTAPIMVDPTTVQINFKVNMNLSYSTFFSMDKYVYQNLLFN